jgi:hypothetical protein
MPGLATSACKKQNVDFAGWIANAICERLGTAVAYFIAERRRVGAKVRVIQRELDERWPFLTPEQLAVAATKAQAVLEGRLHPDRSEPLQ